VKNLSFLCVFAPLRCIEYTQQSRKDTKLKNITACRIELKLQISPNHDISNVTNNLMKSKIDAKCY